MIPKGLLASGRVYLQPQLIVIMLLGFSSGLPLLLTASTLGFWLTEAGVSLAGIGLFALVGTPYTLKFLWAPLMDALRVPVLGRFMGRRRSWLLVTQTALIASMAMLAMSDPAIDPWFTALAAFLMAVSSASQDIVIDAYRVEILDADQQGAGSGAVVMGYRIGMLVAGAGALVLATYVGWSMTYMIMAASCLIGVFTTLFCKEPTVAVNIKTQEQGLAAWLYDAVVLPFVDFMQRANWLGILLFILLYKMGDAFMGTMTSPFYIELGFSKVEIAEIVKIYGVLATVVGGLLGGSIVLKLGLVRSLWVCGFAQILSNLVFAILAMVGKDIYVLAVTITIENLTSGMGTAAFVAFMSRLCNLRFTATQYALLSSFSAFGRAWLSAPAGFVAEISGWPLFFVSTTLLGVPGLLCLWWLMRQISFDQLASGNGTTSQ